MPIEYLESGVLYENPRPHVRSRHGYFPGLARLGSGELLALFVIAEAFEAADGTTWAARSRDLGRTWELEGPVVAADLRRTEEGMLASDCLKPTAIRDGRLAAIGYRFHRADPDQGISIEGTGGVLPGDDIISFSTDEGRTWTEPRVIPRTRPELYEISGPCLELRSGDLIAAAAPFLMPDGANPSGQAGFLLRSKDKGKTWTDDGVFFRSPGGNLTPYESRLCEMPDGRVAAIVWAYDTAAGRHHPNHLAVSRDDGHSWSAPIDTGCRGQASHLVCLGGDSLLTIHAHRGDDPGIVVRVVDFRRDLWQPVEEMVIYGAGSRAQTSSRQSLPEMFAALRFGQPSLLRLTEDEFLAVHWAIEDGQGKIRTHRLRVRMGVS
jgi:sialidase-1